MTNNVEWAKMMKTSENSNPGSELLPVYRQSSLRCRRVSKFFPLAAVVLLFPLVASAQTRLAPGFEEALSFQAVASGNVDANTYGSTPMGSCAGWISEAPVLAVELEEPFDFLKLEIKSSGDPTLVVRGPNGYWCNDDSEGLNPALFGRWAPGVYEIFVGTYNHGDTISYTLTLSEDDGHEDLPPTPVTPLPDLSAFDGLVRAPEDVTDYRSPIVPAVATPTFDAAAVGQYGDITIQTADIAGAPGSLSGLSGGPSATTAPACVGWVAQRPNHLLVLEGDAAANLTISVTSGVDTTLVIEGPGGWLCNDDSVGVNPAVSGWLQPGEYRIWVGNYWGDDPAQYTIAFTR